MKRSIQILVLTLIVLPASPRPLAAQTDQVLADQAEVILIGRVSAAGPSPMTGPAETEYLVTVETVIKGELLHSPVVVRVPTGALRTEDRPRIYGSQLLSRGQRVLLFLAPDAGDGTYGILDRGQGAFHLHHTAGREVAYRSFWESTEPYDPDAAGTGAAGTGAAGTGLAAGRHTQLRDLERFRRWLGERAGGADGAADYFLDADTSSLYAARPAEPLPKSTASHPDAAKAILPVSVSDPAGDATPNPLATPSPDMVSASIRSTGNGDALTMTMQFVAETFEPATSRGRFEINIDEDPDTGLQGLLGTTTGLQGVDFLLVFYDSDVEVRKFDPTLPPGGSLVRIIAHLPATLHADGYTAVIPLEILDGDEEFSFKLLTDVRIGSQFTNFTDFMPDVPLPPGLVRPTPSTTPAAPSGLQASASAADRIELAWNDNAGNEQSFEIQRRTGGGFEQIASVGQNVTSFADTSVSSGTGYTYRVRARNGSGTSDWSAAATATTPGELAPTGLTAAGLSASEILLSWTDNATGEDGYEIEMRIADSGFVSAQTLPADSTATTVGGLDEATVYTFRVRATGGAGASSYSGEASATTFFGDPEPCVAGATTLCLNGGRFKVEVAWQDFAGAVGSAADAGLVSPDSGLLYFFDPDNWEMLLKVLDACDFNGHFWVFAAASTNVEYELTVTDSLTGFSKSYNNPLGIASPAITDTSAFATCSAQVPAASPAPPKPAVIRPAKALPPGGNCTPSDTALCLDQGRFQVEVDWVTDDDSGPGRVDPFRSEDSGLFWFFAPTNLELMIKVLDGCGFNDRVWVFSAATTDVEYTLRVLDTATGEEKQYFNPAGNAAEAVTDIEALASCPG